MTRTTQLRFILLIASLLLAGCGGKPSNGENTVPTADHVVQFDEQGAAVLRGFLSGGWSSQIPNGNFDHYLVMNILVKADGIRTSLAIPIHLRGDTELSSDQTPPTTVREYLVYHPASTPYDVFRAREAVWVEVTFQKRDNLFEASAVHQVRAPRFAFLQKKPAIQGVFATNSVSQGTIRGELKQAQLAGKTVIWLFSTPVEIQGVKVEVWVDVYSANDTEIVHGDQTGILDLEHAPLGFMEIEFTRRGEKLSAHRITRLAANP